MNNLDLSDAVSAVGGGAFATLLQWLLGRRDSAADRRRGAADRRREEVRSIVRDETDVRLAKIEVVLNETRETVKSTNEKLDSLLLLNGGRLHIRRAASGD